VGLPLDEQSLTEGICIRPQPCSEDLIDDNRLTARLGVAVIEGSAHDDWYGQRFEKSRRDKMLRDTDRVVWRGWCPAWEKNRYGRQKCRWEPDE
jgi:hypothetical protein